MQCFSGKEREDIKESTSEATNILEKAFKKVKTARKIAENTQQSKVVANADLLLTSMKTTEKDMIKLSEDAEKMTRPEKLKMLDEMTKQW